MTQLSGEINVQGIVSGDISSRPTLSVGLTNEVKQALLTIAQKVAYIDENGQTYYDALYNALYPPAVLVSISAAFVQGSAVVYDSDSLDVLRQYLTVTGLFDDYTTDTIQGYSLSGTLTAGTSTITVSYGGKSDTFSVSVTHRVWAVTSIDAVFTQGSVVIYDNDPLDVLRELLTVTATYENDSTAVVTSYSLSGTLTVGTSTITVSFGGKTDTFTVTVTQHVAVLTSITAVFTQGNRTIFSNEPLNSLKQWLTVTAVYDDESTEPVADEDYSLAGTLEDGTSTVTASYNGKTASFAVAVTGYEIPAGYEVYDYIQKKNESDSSVNKNSFIWLNDQADLNELSLETKIAAKGTTQHTPALFGVRNSTDWMTSYSVYCNPTQGVAGALRGVAWETGYFLNQTPTVFEILNPATSPAYWRINRGELHEIPWDSTFVIPHGFSILHSLPYNLSGKQYINYYARVGYIILRKNDGECVGYYVPVVHNGIIGMYDIVSEQFYTAATASAVTISDSGCLYSVGNWP